jgi:hypothetical protein
VTNGTAAPPPPSSAALVRATVLALAVAAVLLLTVVLPAEYGMDPLGTGRALGLTNLANASALGADVLPSGAGPVAPQEADYKTDTMTFTLGPSRSVEYKYQLAEGAAMLYAWTATGPVEFDFHTEPALKGAAGSETFARGTAPSGYGSYRAPYDGIHGWYWRNPGQTEVEVTLHSSGFYTAAREFTEDGATIRHAVEPRP